MDKENENIICENVFKGKNEEAIKEGYNNKWIQLINILEGN